jgi:transposase
LSYSTVRDYVRVRRAQIDVEAGRRVEAFVPQEHAPGAEAEVDFGEVWVVLNGVKTKCHMFILRLSHSGRAIHRIYPTQAQEAFLEGHVEAFNVLGGIPTKHIRYDNLTSAVTAVVFGQGRQRQENDRWVLFRSHYGFDPFYCQPGIDGAHEKGGVEGEVGWFRRNRLSPMPVAGVPGRAQRPHPGSGKPRTMPGGSMTGSARSARTSSRTAVPGAVAGGGI